MGFCYNGRVLLRCSDSGRWAPPRIWYTEGNWLLFGMGSVTLLLEIWLVAEGLAMWRRAKGVEPAPLPPFDRAAAQANDYTAA